MKIKKKKLDYSKNNKMKDENTIHVRLEYEESLQSKKDILSSKINLLEAMKAAKKYHSLRLEELKIKTKLYKKIKMLNSNIKILQKILPKIKIPEILSKKESIVEEKIKEDDKKEKIEEIQEKEYDNELETELQEIQNKLHSLTQTNNF